MNSLVLMPSTIQKQEQESAPVRIDIERMKVALAAPSYMMPQGLSREEMRQHIIAHAKQHQ